VAAYGYTESQLPEEPGIALFAGLGWHRLAAMSLAGVNRKVHSLGERS
jgi:hypothetical protein